MSKAASDNAKRKAVLILANQRWAKKSAKNTQAELARLTGLPPEAVCRALNPVQYGPSQATLDKMLCAMGFEAEVVLKEVRS